MPSATPANMKTSIHGRRFGLGNNDELVSNEVQISSPAVDAVITIAASQTSPRAVTVQLNNSDGTPINYRQHFELYLLADAAGAAPATTGGSTGLGSSSSGWIGAIVAKKAFYGMTDATGKWVGTWTDNANEVAFLGVKLPSGRLVVSAALTTA